MRVCDHCAQPQETQLRTLSVTLSGGRFYSVDMCDRCYRPREDSLLALLAGVGEWRGSIARFGRTGVDSRLPAPKRRTAAEATVRDR